MEVDQYLSALDEGMGILEYWQVRTDFTAYLYQPDLI
jgi:hypothetical protein